MEYCFILNQGTPTFLQFDQSLYIYSSYLNVCCNNSEIYSFPQIYANVEPKPQFITECDHGHNIPIISSNTDSYARQTPQPLSPPQNKRRKERTLQKQIKSAKKNSQSNIINQFYSFFANRQNSQKIVQKSLGRLGKTVTEIQKIVPIFYKATRFINFKRGRRYVNAANLIKYFSVQVLGECLADLKDKMQQIDSVYLQEICYSFRRCAKYFAEETSISAILTSKRISVTSKQEHLRKRRRVANCINIR